MTEEEFLELLFGDEDIPEDPDTLLEFATHLYQLSLNPNSPLRDSKEIDWEAFGEVIQKAKAADDEVKRQEQKVKQAEDELKQVLRRFLPEN